MQPQNHSLLNVYDLGFPSDLTLEKLELSERYIVYLHKIENRTQLNIVDLCQPNPKFEVIEIPQAILAKPHPAEPLILLQTTDKTLQMFSVKERQLGACVNLGHAIIFFKFITRDIVVFSTQDSLYKWEFHKMSTKEVSIFTNLPQTTQKTMDMLLNNSLSWGMTLYVGETVHLYSFERKKHQTFPGHAGAFLTTRGVDSTETPSELINFFAGPISSLNAFLITVEAPSTGARKRITRMLTLTDPSNVDVPLSCHFNDDSEIGMLTRKGRFLCFKTDTLDVSKDKQLIPAEHEVVSFCVNPSAGGFLFLDTRGQLTIVSSDSSYVFSPPQSPLPPSDPNKN